MRTLLAFILAPAVGTVAFVLWIFVPMLFAAGSYLPIFMPGKLILAGLRTQVFSYFVMLIMSIPIFLAVRFLCERHWWWNIIAAFLVVLLKNVSPLLGPAHLDEPSIAIAQAVAAFCYGLAFWVIADYKRAQRLPTPTPAR